MVSCSRVVCVAFPLLITLAALTILLIVSFAPPAIRLLYLLEVDLTHLSIDPSTISSLINRGVPVQLASNVSGTDLGLDGIYRVNLWGYCSGPAASNLTCTSPSFDWASRTLNTSYVANLGQAFGVKIVLPQAVGDGLTAFTTSLKWLEVVDIIALILVGLEFALSIFTSCSRVMSCLIWILAGIATSAVTATAIFATVIVAAVLGTLQTQAQPYGVASTSGTTFLVLLWMVVALCVVAGVFWGLSICCCAPDRASRRRPLTDKDQYGGRNTYQPLDVPAQSSRGNFPQQQTWQQTTVYEPWMHRA